MASERLGWGGGDLQGGSQFAKKTSVSEGSEGVFESLLYKVWCFWGGQRGDFFFATDVRECHGDCWTPRALNIFECISFVPFYSILLPSFDSIDAILFETETQPYDSPVSKT